MNTKIIASLFMAVLYTVTLPACTYDRTNKTLTRYGSDQPDWEQSSVEASAEISTDELAEKQVKKRKEMAEAAKKNHGLMHIHRYGPGVDILMTLDAGDSDVSFTMSLPKTGVDDYYSSTESSSEETNTYKNILDDRKSQLHHQELEDRSELIEKKKMTDFHAATKHILSAQSLFYKKQYWKSLDATNTALELIPESAQAHALKGSIYYKMGLSDEAKTSWQSALELDPTMDKVKASLARLR